jgi:hypothetical protein
MVDCALGSAVDSLSGDVCTVLKLSEGTSESTVHDAVICEVGAGVRPVVGVEAATGWEAGLEAELNIATRSSERDCTKASSLFCNSSRLNGSSMLYTLDPAGPWRASIDGIVSESSCSSAVTGRAKVVIYRLCKLSLTEGFSLAGSERLCIP